MNNREHISVSFSSELDSVKNRLLEMGGVVERQITSAIDALTSNDRKMSKQLIDADRLVNEFEVNIGEECARIIALRQPAASDLRLVVTVTRITSELERIGDEAVKIARQALLLGKETSSRTNYAEIKVIAERVSGMLRESLDAFTRLDVQAALEVRMADKRVDEEFSTALGNVRALMVEDVAMINPLICEIWVLKALERVGDHACNIAEQVIFLDLGVDVRHLSSSELQQLLAQ